MHTIVHGDLACIPKRDMRRHPTSNKTLARALIMHNYSSTSSVHTMHAEIQSASQPASIHACTLVKCARCTCVLHGSELHMICMRRQYTYYMHVTFICTVSIHSSLNRIWIQYKLSLYSATLTRMCVCKCGNSLRAGSGVAAAAAVEIVVAARWSAPETPVRCRQAMLAMLLPMLNRRPMVTTQTQTEQRRERETGSSHHLCAKCVEQCVDVSCTHTDSQHYYYLLYTDERQFQWVHNYRNALVPSHKRFSYDGRCAHVTRRVHTMWIVICQRSQHARRRWQWCWGCHGCLDICIEMAKIDCATVDAQYTARHWQGNRQQVTC